jgi:7-carboxy-7-deazaguanine synthase
MNTRTYDKRAQAEISEIFSSLQGEGPYLGVKQVFVRFGRCNMHCTYCDELENMKQEKFKQLSLAQVLHDIGVLEKDKGPHHSVSLTGGEPLFYTPFLENLLPKLKEKRYGTYLETNGTLWRELDRVIRFCDIVAMDMKPSTSTGDRNFEREHEEFLKIAARKEVFVKVVITPETKLEELERCVDIVEAVDPHIPFILQPVTEAFGISTKALQLIESTFMQAAEKYLLDVRMIPQMHKVWGVR